MASIADLIVDRTFLRSSIYFPGGMTFERCIIALEVGIVVSLLIVAAAIIRRIRCGSFWLFKLVRADSARGSFIVVAPINQWLVFSAITLSGELFSFPFFFLFFAGGRLNRSFLSSLSSTRFFGVTQEFYRGGSVAA